MKIALVSGWIHEGWRLAFVTTFVYTMSTTISSLPYAEDADDLGPGTPPESLPLPPRDGTQEDPLRRDAPRRADREDRSGEAEEENAEAAERGVAAGYPRGAGADGSGRVLHAGGDGGTAPQAFRIEYSQRAREDTDCLPEVIVARIFQKMSWYAQPENPFAFAKRLSGSYAGLWRFRIGDYRVICDIDRRRRVLRVLAVRDRREVYRGAE